MKAVLAYLCNYEDRKDHYLSLLPFGLASIAAYLQHRGIDTVLANLSLLGHGKGARWIAAEKPDLLGVSVFAFNRAESMKLIAEAARLSPGTAIVAGGPFASHYHKEIMERYPQVRNVVIGEGEKALYRLIGEIENGAGERGPVRGDRLRDLDRIPFASSFTGRMYGVNPLEQFSYLITSRGCPGSCTYCCSPEFWGGRPSFRSPENIVDEMERLYRDRGIIYFSIRDDNFTMGKKRVVEFSRELRRRGVHALWNCQARVDTVDPEMIAEMKRSGLEHLQFGVESGSERILRMMDKGTTIEKIRRAADMTRAAGVTLSIYLMTGMPGETDDDTEATLRLIRRIKPHDGMVSPVALYPGTALYEGLRESGEVGDDVWFTSGDSGIYARRDPAVARWTRMLARELALSGEKWGYDSGDFRKHREQEGGDCWVTDIMEGERAAALGDLKSAVQIFSQLTEKMPDNPWGFIRLGETALMKGDNLGAIRAYRGATGALPSYYGAWLELAVLYDGRGDRAAAVECAERAGKLNSYDDKVRRLVKKIISN